MNKDMIFWDEMWNKSSQQNNTKMELNYSRLIGEYLDWSLSYDDGRNKQDLKFGQYLWTKYDNMNLFSDVFYAESCETVYSILLNDLYKLEIL